MIRKDLTVTGVTVWLFLSGFAPLPQAPKLDYDLRDEAERSSADQLVAQAEPLVLAGLYEQARPLLDRLAELPQARLQSNFMEGYVARETGKLDEALKRLKAVVEERPDYARGHLEYARALMLKGKTKSAAREYALAVGDASLAPELRELAKAGQKEAARYPSAYVTVDAGVAVDSNVTNATDLQRANVNHGEITLPIALDPSLREQDGIGPSIVASGGVRVPVAEGVTIAADAEGFANIYPSVTADDISILLAMGPEVAFDSGATSAVQLIAFERWYGGDTANAGAGVRARHVQPTGEGRKIYLYVDGRIFQSDYGDDFEGTQASAYLTYEHLLSRDLSVTGSAYVKREWLGSEAFSNTELGIFGGVNAFLSPRLSGGLSAGVTRVLFDDALVSLSPDPRRDWRVSGTVYLTTRQAVALGLFPVLSYSYTNTFSSIPFYRTDRHRLRVSVVRAW